MNSTGKPTSSFHCLQDNRILHNRMSNHYHIHIPTHVEFRLCCAHVLNKKINVLSTFCIALINQLDIGIWYWFLNKHICCCSMQNWPSKIKVAILCGIRHHRHYEWIDRYVTREYSLWLLEYANPIACWMQIFAFVHFQSNGIIIMQKQKKMMEKK